MRGFGDAKRVAELHGTGNTDSQRVSRLYKDSGSQSCIGFCKRSAGMSRDSCGYCSSESVNFKAQEQLNCRGLLFWLGAIPNCSRALGLNNTLKTLSRKRLCSNI